MKLVGFRQASAAHLLVNYLSQENIKASVNEDETNGYVVILHNANQFEQAKAIVNDFVNNPSDKKYQDAAWSTGDAVDVKNKPAFPVFNPAALLAAPIVSVVLLTCVLSFTIFLLGGFNALASLLKIQPFAVLTQSHEWWRIVTPAFIHYSMLHIVFNVLWWWILGREVEKRFGSTFIVMFFLVTAALSNIAQLLVSGPNFGGLSGVVYALMGFVWWIGWLKPQWGLMLPKPMIGFMLVWLVIGYADVLWVNMANTAHTAGLVSGCLVAWVMAKVSKN